MSDRSGVQVAVIAEDRDWSVRRPSGNGSRQRSNVHTACGAFVTPHGSQEVMNAVDRALPGPRGVLSLRMAVPLTVGALVEAVSPGWASSLKRVPAHSKFERLRKVLSDNGVRTLHLHLTKTDERSEDSEVVRSNAIFHELASDLGLELLILSGREQALAAVLDDPQIRRRLRVSRVGSGPSWEDDVSRQVHELGSGALHCREHEVGSDQR